MADMFKGWKYHKEKDLALTKVQKTRRNIKACIGETQTQKIQE